MPKYYDVITEKTYLKHQMGSSLQMSPDFGIFSSTIFSQCVFLQNLIQQIIYTSHGAELLGAKRTLRDFPNPKARVDFLCSFPYRVEDPVVSKVFDFSRSLFKEIYEFRNVLAHEVWSSSDEYPGSILFSTLDENSRLLMATGKLWHSQDTRPQDIYEATVRFIKKVKIVSCGHLHAAISDIDLCSWSLMHINNILNEEDPWRRSEARKAFFVYRGTSHLFSDAPSSSGTVEFYASKGKTINQANN